MHDDIAIHIRNWIFSMKMHKCYSSLAYRRMNHVIYKHCIIHFSQIHVTQRLSGKTGYSSPNCWILNRAFGHLAAQNCQQWQHQENELPNHGAMPEGAGSFLLGSHHGHLQHDGRTIFLWCTAQLPQHGTGEGTTLQGIKNRKSIKAGICLAPEGAMSSHSTAAKAVAAGCVPFPAVHCCPGALEQPRTQLCCFHDLTSTGTERAGSSDFFHNL